MTGLQCEENQPCSAADEVTQRLPLQASPLRRANVMLELPRTAPNAIDPFETSLMEDRRCPQT